MKILNFISISLTFLCLQSCETYGPASRFQATKYMETPFFDGVDTSSYYVSGRYIGGILYKPNDGNKSGSLNVHYSKMSDKNMWLRRWKKRQYKHYAIGGLGMLGQYNAGDSLNLNFHTFGIRGELGQHYYSANNKTHYGFVMTFAQSYENGSFHTFRDDFEKKRNPYDNYIAQKWSTDLGFRHEIKHQFKENRVAQFGFGVDFNINKVVFPNFYVDASYQFNRNLHLNLNYVFLTKKNESIGKSLINFINLGIAYGF